MTVCELGQPILNLASVSRSYALIAALEKVGTEAWQNQLDLTVNDVKAINRGEVTPRLMAWFKQRQAVEQRILASLSQK